MKFYGYCKLNAKENSILPVVFKDNDEFYIQCVQRGKIVLFNNVQEYDNSQTYHNLSDCFEHLYL